jgi:hypothetical protein
LPPFAPGRQAHTSTKSTSALICSTAVVGVVAFWSNRKTFVLFKAGTHTFTDITIP